MNRQGVFLTLMVFFIGIVVIGLAISSTTLEKERESLLPQNTARSVVNEQFEQVHYDIENLLINNKRAKSQSRSLLFNYEINNNNSIFIEQELPITGKQFDEFNDFLNLYTIFFKESNKETSVDAEFSFHKLKNFYWGGSQRWPDYNYKILPQCIIYGLDYENNNKDDKRIMTLEKGTMQAHKCDFDREQGKALKNYYKIQKLEIKIVSSTGITEGSISCQGSFGTVNCRNDSFNPENIFPYGKIEFFKGKTLIETVSTHFNPRIENTITFQLKGDSGIQRISFGEEQYIAKINLSTGQKDIKTTASINLSLREPAEAILLEGFSTVIEHKGFGIRRLSQLEEQKTYCGDYYCDSGESAGNCPEDCFCELLGAPPICS